MKYRLILFDVDSTLIKQEVIDLLADKSGHGREVQQITARAMRGEIDFAQALFKRVSLLEGLPESVFTEVLSQISFAEGFDELFSYHKIELENTVAVGDGANDIDMIELAGLGVSYMGKEILRQKADLHLEKAGLNALIQYLN